MNTRASGDIMSVYGQSQEDSADKNVEAKRVMSEDKQHYILIKSAGRSGGNTLFTGIVEDDDEEYCDDSEKTDHFKRIERQPAEFKEVYLDEVTAVGSISESSSDDDEGRENQQQQHHHHNDQQNQQQQHHNDQQQQQQQQLKAEERQQKQSLKDTSEATKPMLTVQRDSAVDVQKELTEKPNEHETMREERMPEIMVSDTEQDKKTLTQTIIIENKTPDFRSSTSDEEGFLSVGSPASSRGPFSPVPKDILSDKELDQRPEYLDKCEREITSKSELEALFDGSHIGSDDSKSGESQLVNADTLHSRQAVGEEDLTLASAKRYSTEKVMLVKDSTDNLGNEEKGIC